MFSMDNVFLEFISLFGLTSALLVSIYTDLKSRKLYDKVAICIILLAPLYWYATDTFTLVGIGIHILIAIVVFLFFSLFFALGAMKGGDVKLFTAIALWFTPTLVFHHIFYTSILGAFVTIIFWALHKIKKNKGKTRVPYGVAIALGCFIIIGERFFNHFS